MVQQAPDRTPTEHELSAALREEAFALHYQPIRDTDHLQLVAYESLLRWPHPVRGMISPLDFIPLAERHDLIHDLGLWVVRQACRDIAALDARYVGVNVSGVQLRRSDFAARFASVVGQEGIEPSQVTVEITESVPLHDDGPERRNLTALRDMGCYLAIDDFGTGHASFDYIDRFPFNVLKIDKSFVWGLGVTPSADALVALLCDLGRRREVVIVAEGVETQAQLDRLRQLGCPRIQGYMVGRPAPAAAWARVAPLRPAPTQHPAEPHRRPRARIGA